jgi:hypothetical protein
MTHHRLSSLARIPHLALTCLALAWLSGCVVTQSPEPTAPPPPADYPPQAEYPAEPGPPQAYPSAPYHNDGPAGRRPLPPHRPRPAQPPPPAADCSRRPAAACCKALTPECNACVDRARAAQEQWDRECASAGPVQPGPGKPAVDCSEAPGAMCCEAQTAECSSCRRRAAAERAAWARECQAEAPPATPAPAPVVDCTQPPGRMCCQAETPACHSCKREAAAERAAWERQCT